MIRLVAVVLVAAVAAALPASAKERRHHHRSAKVVKVERSHARKAARWGFARRRRPARPVSAPPKATAGAPAPVPTATPAPTGPTVPASNPRSVSVRSKEWSFTLSQPSVLAGEVRIQFDNRPAEDPHELAVLGDDPGELWRTGLQGPGEVSARAYALEPGSYTLFCPLPEHEARGMKAVLTVR